jgi:hypothetical protein
MEKGPERSIVNDAIVKDLHQVLRNLKYGTVTLKVHDSKVVQIEVSEKRRYDDVWTIEGGAGI